MFCPSLFHDQLNLNSGDISSGRKLWELKQSIVRDNSKHSITENDEIISKAELIYHVWNNLCDFPSYMKFFRDLKANFPFYKVVCADEKSDENFYLKNRDTIDRYCSGVDIVFENHFKDGESKKQC